MRPLLKRRIIRESLWFLPCAVYGVFIAWHQNTWQYSAWVRYGYIEQPSTASIVAESLWIGAILGVVMYLVISAVRFSVMVVIRMVRGTL
jgi:hypothetical protein